MFELHSNRIIKLGMVDTFSNVADMNRRTTRYEKRVLKMARNCFKLKPPIPSGPNVIK
jgi:hypothetical protein